MRSYRYGNGIWQEIVDPFPTIPSSGNESFLDALRGQGFGVSTYTTRRFDCMLGRLTLYSREHEKLGFKRKEKEFEYDFLCVLSAPSTYIRVWIPDLPSLLLFFREVEVQHETKAGNELTTVLKEFLTDDDLQRLLIRAVDLLQLIQEHGLPVRMNPPQRRT